MGVNITRQFPTHGPEHPMVPSEAPRGAAQGTIGCSGKGTYGVALTKH
jgi:hypothetical protein